MMQLPKFITFIPIYRKLNHIDAHLTTTEKGIHILIDEILNEISGIKKITNRSRVREALKLGAGQYIKKPYTIKKLAHAIKEELAALKKFKENY
jgi:response regulator of citrate/malate metabolism